MCARRAAAAIALLAACSDGEEAEPLAVPDTGTAWVIFGTAPAGRAVLPTTVIVRRASELLSLRPDSISGGEVDMFFAGFEERDLPDGVDPASLSFVLPSADRAHRLFALKEPFVLEAPRPSGSPLPLVPVESANPAVQKDRQRRLESLTRDLALRDPCADPAAAISVITPRTSAEDVRAMRTLSSGETWLAFSATSTAILGVVRPGEMELSDIVPISTGSLTVNRSDRIRITDLGDGEAIDRRGRIVPTELSFNFVSAFGGLGALAELDVTTGEYRETTPNAPGEDLAPGVLAGVRHVELDGERSLCAYGRALGPNQVAVILCRVETSTVWHASAAVSGGIAIHSLIARPSARPLASDTAGTIYQYLNHRWEAIIRPTINDGCQPPCAALDTVITPRRPGELIAVLAGSAAEALVLVDRGGELSELAIEPLKGALFADERRDGEHPMTFTAGSISADGAIWLAATESVIFRVAPDRGSVARICLPPEARGSVISAVETHPDGRLILGMSPALLGFGRWDE